MYSFKKIFALTVAIFLLVACGSSQKDENKTEVDAPDYESVQTNVETQVFPPSTGQIYLFGEGHLQPHLMNLQFELWSYFYNEHGMRHLFLETCFITTEVLNLWMQEESDEIFNYIFREDYFVLRILNDENRESIKEAYRNFFLRIKKELPETIFHGVDIGIKNDYVRPIFLQHLIETGQYESELYRIVLQKDQEKAYFGSYNNFYDSFFREREEILTSNFIQTFDSLQGESIMGVFGAAHVRPGYELAGIPNLADRLIERYGTQVHAVDLNEILFQRVLENPVFVEKEIDGNVYEALFLSETYVYWDNEQVKWIYYLIEGAYEDFRNHLAPDYGRLRDIYDFPMPIEAIEIGHIFVLEVLYSDGSIEPYYYRVPSDDLMLTLADYTIAYGNRAVERFIVEN